MGGILRHPPSRSVRAWRPLPSSRAVGSGPPLSRGEKPLP
jgi:hypothetical protein